MIPGETPFTRIPKEAYSMASDRVAAASPPFVSAVSTAGVLELATSARVAVTLTTWPPYRLAISAMARWVTPEEPGEVDPDGRRVVGGGLSREGPADAPGPP